MFEAEWRRKAEEKREERKRHFAGCEDTLKKAVIPKRR